MRLLPALLLLLQSIITVHTELVVVPAVVTDKTGRHVTGLRQEDFHIYEDGRLRPTEVFHHGDAPITLGLIVDRSASMRPKVAALLTAVSSLLESSRTEDELFAVDFNDRVSFELPADHPFTSDAKVLEAALLAPRAEGRTALYDGVADGLQQLEAGHGQRHALIVISDGGDNASRRTYADVLALARRSDAVIYAIGLTSTSGDAEADDDEGLLKRLCKDTGGLAFFPRKLEEIASVAAQVASDLHEQYTLGFSPAERTGRGAFRKIEVVVTQAGAGRPHVRTRPGYLSSAPGPKP